MEPQPHHYPHLQTWKPGVSGDPLGAGRHKLQLASRSARSATMVELLFDVMRGLPLSIPVKPGRNGRGGSKPRPSPELRLRAAEILLDRAFGKAKEIIELVGEGSEDERRRQSVAMIRHLSVEEQDQLGTLLHTARERAGEIPPSTTPWTTPEPAPRVDTPEGR